LLGWRSPVLAGSCVQLDMQAAAVDTCGRLCIVDHCRSGRPDTAVARRCPLRPDALGLPVSACLQWLAAVGRRTHRRPEPAGAAEPDATAVSAVLRNSSQALVLSGQPVSTADTAAAPGLDGVMRSQAVDRPRTPRRPWQ